MNNTFNEIGGYIELELPRKISKSFTKIQKSKIALNSGRNAIRYIIKAYNIKKLYVPYYTCPVVWDALKQEKIELVYYSVNDKLLPEQKFSPDSYVLYTNYFGVCSKNVIELSKKYKNLIIDNAQAFYMPQYGIGSAYSPRKFFGVSDGGYVCCHKKLDIQLQKDISYNRFSHLLKRIDCGSNSAYEDFWKNENSINDAEILQMSNLTESILQSIDYDKIKRIRIENFKYLHKHLKSINTFKINITKEDVPMYYPFLCKNDLLREKFIENKIYIPTCWREMEQNCLENSYELYLQKYMFPLIIDQRYNLDDMNKIIAIIENEYK